MRLISGRAVVVVSLVLGIPLIIIGCEADKVNAARAPQAKCIIDVGYPNVTGNGWLGYYAVAGCWSVKPNSVRVTFQILRANKQWRVLRTSSSPVQFTTRCRKGGKTVPFRPRVIVTARDAKGGNLRLFSRTGPSFHWRCLPR